MPLTIDQLKKQARVIDMMLTMHSILYSRYRRRAMVLDIFLLGASTIIAATTFLDPAVLNFFSLKAETIRYTLGIASIAVFFITLVTLVVDWKGLATQHKEAFNALIPIKSEWSQLLATLDNHDERSISDFVSRSALVTGSLIPIPDNYFNSLKARHYSKVELSKLISAHPSAPVILLRLILIYKAIRALGDNDHGK